MKKINKMNRDPHTHESHTRLTSRGKRAVGALVLTTLAGGVGLAHEAVNSDAPQQTESINVYVQKGSGYNQETKEAIEDNHLNPGDAADVTKAIKLAHHLAYPQYDTLQAGESLTVVVPVPDADNQLGRGPSG